MRMSSRIVGALGALSVLALWACGERGVAASQRADACAGASPCLVLATDSGNGDELAQERLDLVRTVAEELHRTLGADGIGAFDQRILTAMQEVPRHAFVPPALAPYAYLNRPLPIGFGQTVSQPSLVALMTHLAGAGEAGRVLLVGVGGGYHVALLSRLAHEVVCVELLPAVAEQAEARLERLGYADNVRIVQGDGFYGWNQDAPFDAIIVRQAVNHVPPPLMAQLARGGRLVMPVGPPDGPQFLTLVEKGEDGSVSERRVLPVRFTTMPGGERI